MKRLLMTLVLASLMGCTWKAALLQKLGVRPTVALESKTAKEWDSIEATFRYEFGGNESGQQQNAHVYCLELSVGGRSADPDDAFMKRFADNQPPVKKRSECEYSKEQSGIVDGKTGASGLSFSVEDVQRVSDTEAKVSGGYYEGPLSAGGTSSTTAPSDLVPTRGATVAHPSAQRGICAHPLGC